MSEYVSSIVNLYGDSENVTKDSKLIREILDRQGTNLLIHVISEHIGETVLRHNLDETEVTRVVGSLVTELKESIRERT